MIPTHIVVHHSATGPEATFDQIRAVHLARGWDDIGYHFVIGVSGEILPGRAEDVVGAHALGINQHSLGICCIGNYEEAPIGELQLDSLIRLLQDLVKRHGIEAANIIGHCDVTCEERGAKRSLCPGKFLYEKLGGIREELASRCPPEGILSPSERKRSERKRCGV